MNAIVVDASAVLEVLLRTPRAERISRRILADDAALHAPHLLDVEVAQVLRRYARAREVGVARATQALADFMDMRVERYPMEPLLGRIWALRDSVTGVRRRIHRSRRGARCAGRHLRCEVRVQHRARSIDRGWGAEG